jgi:hypothetical protein
MKNPKVIINYQVIQELDNTYSLAIQAGKTADKIKACKDPFEALRLLEKIIRFSLNEIDRLKTTVAAKEEQ